MDPIDLAQCKQFLRFYIEKPLQGCVNTWEKILQLRRYGKIGSVVDPFLRNALAYKAANQQLCCFDFFIELSSSIATATQQNAIFVIKFQHMLGKPIKIG